MIVTTSGSVSVSVDQRVNGGRWVRLDAFALAAGDRDVVAVSRMSAAGGPIIADAIRISSS